MEANAVVTGAFATPPPRINNRMKRLTTLFDMEEIMSDNALISIYPLGEKYYCFYESTYLQCVDVDTLKTVKKVDLRKSMGAGVVVTAAHPHYDEDGNMLTLSIKVGLTGPEYVVTKVSPKREDQLFIEHKPDEDFGECEIVASAPSRWLLEPGYMHTFAITENYAIMIEQPMTVNVGTALNSILRQKAMCHALKWYDDSTTNFHVINRRTGDRLKVPFKAKGFFYLHTINAYEDEGHIVIDICCYDNPNMLYCMELENLKTAQSQEAYATLFRGRPKRYKK